MSRKLLTVAVLVTLILPLAPSPARAQFSYGVAAGATKALGQLGPQVNVGYNAMASVSFLPPLAPLGFRFDGMYNEFGYKPDSAIGIPAGSKGRVFAATASAVLASPGFMGPYLIGGVGYYRFSVSPSTAGASSQNDIGANIGVGYRIALAGFSAFGEARYHYVGSNRYQMVPISIGVTF
jgi:hypothetical protein